MAKPYQARQLLKLVERYNLPKDIKARYPAASFLAGNRVVFNIKGNKYRLITHVRYDPGRVYIRFIGTHPEYDKVNAATI
jgi:mRNA interferase HigB